MHLRYHTYRGMPEEALLADLQQLHQDVFGGSDDLAEKMARKQGLLLLTAQEGDTLVGYKVGYPLEERTFYSWLGGVAPGHRRRGIAKALMDMQHYILRQEGYTHVQTKTRNQWRSMILCNLQSGFDIIDTYLTSDFSSNVCEKRRHLV
ncbi:GNAT family N-acetyltransferase [Alkalicoccus chagannorensis]|uniref:GNAT family N-acetyltransferase n=1 Tax=Alkalicoccus chagannorensis TaxID=427072 RepID=UPI00041EC5A1|nr:GNAT family N-acetyltransferase [Alkalicoccus chagannorensis]